MNQQLDRHLTRAIAEIAIWLEFSDSKTVDPDAAIQALEQFAAELRLMEGDSKLTFIQQLKDIAKEYTGSKADFVEGLPESLGLIDSSSDS